MKYKYSLGVVFYKPEEEQISNALKYANYPWFRAIYVFDNSPQEISNMDFPEKVSYHFMGGNSGLSVPYNKMIVEAIAAKDDFLCLMDQDSCFEENEMRKIVDYIESYDNKKLDNVALVCPFIETEYRRNNTTKDEEYINWAINSGSFLNLEVIDKNKIHYDEKVFLDGVDYDFGWSIKKQGKKILRFNKATLFQSFGYFRGGSTFAKHDAQRYYNIAHNRKYIFKKHYGMKGIVVAYLINFRLFFRILLHEDSKTKKALACIKGTLR